jgi:5,10-methylene-tetrahydrofolate dehydrogenase/methenyl tetrahydrofolate cyclohydrolase
MVKDGAVVIDVGIHRIEDDSEKGYHIVGDVDFDTNDIPKEDEFRPLNISEA